MDCTAGGSNENIAKRPGTGKSENSRHFSPVLHPLTAHSWKAEKWIRQKNGLPDVSAAPYFCLRDFLIHPS
jgi:hypothetical protein